MKWISHIVFKQTRSRGGSRRGWNLVHCTHYRSVHPLRIWKTSKTKLLISPLKNVRHPIASNVCLCWTDIKPVHVRNFILTFLAKYARHIHKEWRKKGTEPHVRGSCQLTRLCTYTPRVLAYESQSINVILELHSFPTRHDNNNTKYSVPALPRSCKESNSRRSDGLMKDIIITKLSKWIHRDSICIYTSAIVCISRHYPRLFYFVPIWVLRLYSSSSRFFVSAMFWLRVVRYCFTNYYN